MNYSIWEKCWGIEMKRGGMKYLEEWVLKFRQRWWGKASLRSRLFINIWTMIWMDSDLDQKYCPLDVRSYFSVSLLVSGLLLRKLMPFWLLLLCLWLFSPTLWELVGLPGLPSAIWNVSMTTLIVLCISEPFSVSDLRLFSVGGNFL